MTDYIFVAGCERTRYFAGRDAYGGVEYLDGAVLGYG